MQKAVCACELKLMPGNTVGTLDFNILTVARYLYVSLERFNMRH